MRLTMVLAFLVGCGGGKVTSDQEAELAWIGLEGAIDKALTLGLQGFSEASSANIDAQNGLGDETGTITVTGQADQGSSDNKGLRLDIALADYSDFVDLDEDKDEELSVTYTTPDGETLLADLKLRDMPDGTLSGTVTGNVGMFGDLEGLITLSLSVDGPTESDGGDGVMLVDGQTQVSGTATNDDGGVYDVDVTR